MFYAVKVFVGPFITSTSKVYRVHMLVSIKFYKYMSAIYGGTKIKQEKAACLWVTASLETLLGIEVNTESLQRILNLLFTFGLRAFWAAVSLFNAIVYRFPDVTVLASPNGFSVGIEDFRAKPFKAALLSNLVVVSGLKPPAMRAALALPNVVVSRLPGVPIFALPGGQRPGIGNFRTKPLETTILSQPVKIFRLSRYAMRTTFSFCSMKHRLPDVPIFAFPGGFGVATKNFRTKPFETTILGYLVVIFRLKILAFWAALITALAQ